MPTIPRRADAVSLMVDEPDLRALRHQRILEAATTVFLANGYLGTSMDEVAALAGVSKQTVYKRFQDKEHLFTTVIMHDINDAQARMAALAGSLETTTDLEADLLTFARQLSALVLEPRMLQFRRIVIGEADRFPDIARQWYERGPGHSVTALALIFAALNKRKLLRLTDPRMAAEHFIWLVLSIPLNQVMFHGVQRRPTGRDLARPVRDGVRVFLVAYGAEH